MTSVEIGDGVTSIGDEAFEYCDSLTSVEIPDSVTSIGYSAFRGCTSLTSITVDQNNTVYKSIDGNLYSKDGTMFIQYAIGKKDTSFSIPDSVTSIGDGAFLYCSSLTSVVIPDSVTSIGSSAFYGCSSLTSVYITDLTAWCKISFDNSSANPLYYAGNLYLNNELVTDLVIPDSVTSIGDFAFYDCDSLTSVEIGGSVTSIGAYAFYGCSSLTSVVIGDSVTSIGAYAFYGCSSLTSVVIGDSVTSIGDDAFRYCYKLVEVVNKSTHITVTKGNSSNGYVGYYAKNIYTPTSGASKLTNDNGYIIYTDGNEKILIGYTGKETDLTLPSYITKIYQYAFRNCSSLTSVEIPDSVTSIGKCAFFECSSLTSVEIPDSVTSIGSDAFSDCSSLTEITLPFVGASKNATGYQSVFGYIFGYTTSTSSSTISGATYQYYASSNYYHYYIPTSLKKVTITDGNIGSYAFRNCSSLTSVVIGDSVTSIESYAFSDCSSLTSVVIGDSVTSIGYHAFEYCSSLTSVVIGDSVTSIGGGAFYNSGNLKIVYYKGTASEWSGISIDNDNSELTNVTCYYYSEAQPTASGNYWHYDEDGNVAVW